MNEQPTQSVKRSGGGRPKGSKNKKSIINQLQSVEFKLPSDYEDVMNKIEAKEKEVFEILNKSDKHSYIYY